MWHSLHVCLQQMLWADGETYRYRSICYPNQPTPSDVLAHILTQTEAKISASGSFPPPAATASPLPQAPHWAAFAFSGGKELLWKEALCVRRRSRRGEKPFGLQEPRLPGVGRDRPDVPGAFWFGGVKKRPIQTRLRKRKVATPGHRCMRQASLTKVLLVETRNSDGLRPPKSTVPLTMGLTRIVTSRNQQ